MKKPAKNIQRLNLHTGHGYAFWELSIKMAYMGYNTSLSLSLASFFEAKERAFIKAKEDKEGRRGLLRKQRLEGEVA